MTHPTLNGRPVHPAARMYAEECKAGKLSRREFMARATALGVTAAGAYGLIGVRQPAVAQPAIAEGGDMKMQMDVLPIKDPRISDFSQIANAVRGTLEYLVEYNNDGSIRGMLLESWEISEDAKTYTLKVRPNAKWNNGEPFTAADVARNIERWCEAEVPANSMASRMASLVDPDTKMAGEGVIEVVDDMTVKLNLPKPDITIIPGMADYPAAIVHSSYDEALGKDNVGTGPFLIESHEVGVQCTIVRNTEHEWWGTEVYGGPYLDSLQFVDYGTDPAAWLAALESEEVDANYESVGEYIDLLTDLGFVKSEAVTTHTIVIRPNQLAEVDGKKPYEDVRVRKALAMAVDNAVCLELGYSDRGTTANNDHVSPLHPEYADIGPVERDVESALALLEEAGMLDFEHELMSIDDDWRRNTTDAVAAQLRDAGINVKRTILPGSTFWNDWTKYPFSSTNWNGRPLGVQIYALAYRSGEAWNEFGWANAEFDALLDEALAIADADKRREVSAKMQQLVRDEGVTIQPYWRTVYRHTREGVVGAERHISDEIHAYKYGFAA
ncbi:ABC transporter substrate-binding protein [Tropicimonas sediminicola]|uniref:Peptide/nickel transport system substrate-binding protein n=1 Tax=Tropicimonas sediminicola TaxID=1031541 RepID=A0A239HD48_9RHOB|nr:ABC transporter substrate-binding protein [Tropicimonas sediminicola]SNS79366.1 peptide/nickel transport system substrate-binding protein [Tropicimonas sediminicola]